eukprot:TRINITY_DN21993_c0_g1_i1.p1 TRINITY_DN21993_c0_g1~~TRINITY_DN21993_c0_g1_i1.p1  ORF type:complete len:263 (+),score=73.45 TRINITY_DN21993_c0_g1_i1:42-830(+)
MAETEPDPVASAIAENEPAVQGGSVQEQTPKKGAKRQRTEKAFEEYTFAELRQFHKQAARELAEARGQVARLEAEAEEQLAKKEAALPEEAQRVKRAVELQLKAQMTFQKELSKHQVERLKGEDGRDIVAVIPNVGTELLGILGLDEFDEHGNIKEKLTSEFFSNPPTRTQHTPASDASLHLVPRLSFKYIKKVCELKVFAAYRFGSKVSCSKHAKKPGEVGKEDDHVQDDPEKEGVREQDEDGAAIKASEAEQDGIAVTSQ